MTRCNYKFGVFVSGVGYHIYSHPDRQISSETSIGITSNEGEELKCVWETVWEVVGHMK